MDYISFKGEILSTSDALLSGFEPGMDSEQMNSVPVAMYGTHNSPRIVAQKGVFLIFGKNIEDLKIFYEKSNYEDNLLRCMVIKADKIESMLKSLIRTGFSDSTIFPDLEGLAREIKRYFNYGV